MFAAAALALLSALLLLRGATGGYPYIGQSPTTLTTSHPDHDGDACNLKLLSNVKIKQVVSPCDSARTLTVNTGSVKIAHCENKGSQCESKFIPHSDGTYGIVHAKCCIIKDRTKTTLYFTVNAGQAGCTTDTPLELDVHNVTACSCATKLGYQYPY